MKVITLALVGAIAGLSFLANIASDSPQIRNGNVCAACEAMREHQ